MKNIMKNVFKSIIFIFILLVLLGILSYLLLTNKENVKKYGINVVSNNEILSEEKNTIDVIAIGDSLVYSSLSPMILWKNYGFTSFDCASAAQVISDTYKELKYGVETQKPKVVIMEADVLFRNPKKVPWYYKFTKIENYFSLFHHHNNWKKYLFSFINTNSIFTKENIYKGFKYINKTKPGKNFDYMKKTNKKNLVSDNNIKYFEKIVELCNENDIKLLLVSLPNMRRWTYSKSEEASELAKEYNIEFIDFNKNQDLLNIDWKTESRDGGGHLNYSGAIKATNYIGEYIKKYGILKDHRNDKEYDNWNEAYKYYIESLK